MIWAGDVEGQDIASISWYCGHQNQQFLPFCSDFYRSLNLKFGKYEYIYDTVLLNIRMPLISIRFILGWCVGLPNVVALSAQHQADVSSYRH
jgi:hypothetical protein